MNFGLIGAAGYIAPKHLKAILETGGTLIAAADRHDCVGRLDGCFPDAEFYTEIERFELRMEGLRAEGQAVDCVSICTPNHLHAAHAAVALRAGADAICEKPLVTSPAELDRLAELEQRFGRRVWSVLQLRLAPTLMALRERLRAAPARGRADVCLSYITRRGRWYDASWKGDREKSGGVAMNIGIHFFDLLLWLFGGVQRSEVHLSGKRRMAGRLELEGACVRWLLSTDAADLPPEVLRRGGFAHRSMTLDGEPIEFSGGFTDLHTRVYQEVRAGRGFGLEDARPAIELAYGVSRDAPVRPAAGGEGHPLLALAPGPSGRRIA